MQRETVRKSRTVSRVMSRMIIYLVPASPPVSSDPPEDTTGRRIAFCSVLLRMGFTYAPSVASRAVVSYTALPTLPGIFPAVHFCCTILGVTSTGRYPASCPVKPGLSSPAAFRHLQPRTSVLLASNTLTHFFYLVKSKVPRQRSDPFRRPLSSRAGHTAHSGDGRHDLSPR